MSRLTILRLRARHQWYVVEWAIVGSIFTVVLIIAFSPTLLWHTARPRNMAPVNAWIVSLQALETSYPDAANTVVIARTRTGNTGRSTVRGRDIRGCEIGDPIDAYEEGLRVILHPAPCP